MKCTVNNGLCQNIRPAICFTSIKREICNDCKNVMAWRQMSPSWRKSSIVEDQWSASLSALSKPTMKEFIEDEILSVSGKRRFLIYQKDVVTDVPVITLNDFKEYTKVLKSLNYPLLKNAIPLI